MKSIKAELIFVTSKRDNKSLISFVAQNPEDLTMYGCPERLSVRKSIVVVSKDIQNTITPGIKYNCDIKPMRGGARGYVAVKADKVTYDAKLEVIYVKKALYQLKVTWGGCNKAIFDPFTGKTPSTTQPKAFLSYLSKRTEIGNKQEIWNEAVPAMKALIENMDNDGVNVLTRSRW